MNHNSVSLAVKSCMLQTGLSVYIKKHITQLHVTMKGTKVQTLGALYACAPLIDGLSHLTRSATYLSANVLASCVIVSGF